MPFTIVRQDITKMKVDAIVNAANTELLMGGGVCGAIFNAAGAKELQEACDKKSPIKTGDAVITPGFKLPAKFVIHAAGPVYNHNNKGKSAALLSSAYINSLRLAVENNDCGCEPDCCTKVYKEQNSETSKLIRKDDHVVYGNSGYLGAPERPEIINDETLSQVEFRINKPHENIQSTSLSFFICR